MNMKPVAAVILYQSSPIYTYLSSYKLIPLHTFTCMYTWSSDLDHFDSWCVTELRSPNVILTFLIQHSTDDYNARAGDHSERHSCFCSPLIPLEDDVFGTTALWSSWLTPLSETGDGAGEGVVELDGAGAGAGVYSYHYHSWFDRHFVWAITMTPTPFT